MDSKDNYQQFLDKKQYSKKGVDRYEWIFGKTFLSTGGLSTTKKFVAELKLKPGQHVLDVGCGLGGHAFYMAENFDVYVTGVDLSVNMMTGATEHLSNKPHLSDKVKFVLCDITESDYDDDSFDAIYSRDAFLHIQNKDALFAKFKKWLKPGGKIFFTDYTKSEKEYSHDFHNYITDRNYHLLTKSEYKQILEKYFTNISVEDVTEEFLNALHEELNKLRESKNEFLQQFSLEDYEYLENGWAAKIRRVAEGNQTWTACYAEKFI